MEIRKLRRNLDQIKTMNIRNCFIKYIDLISISKSSSMQFENEQGQGHSAINQKLIPKGAYAIDQAKNFRLIKQYILATSMFNYTAPFRYQFLSYVICFESNSKQSETILLYHQISKRLLLKAEKITKQIGDKYLIQCGKTEKIVGRLRANFMGNHFLLFDAGLNPKKKEYPIRKQLASIHINKENILSSCPGTVSCVLANHRKVEGFYETDNQCSFETEGVEQIKSSESSLDYLAKEHSKKIYSIESIKPKYCSLKKKYTIDLKGLVTEPSPINLVMKTMNEDECLVMGKRTENTFSLFVGVPLTLLQGFSIFIAHKCAKNI